MNSYVRNLLTAVATIGCVAFIAHGAPSQHRTQAIVLEVIRNSWNGERDETLVICAYIPTDLRRLTP